MLSLVICCFFSFLFFFSLAFADSPGTETLRRGRVDLKGAAAPVGSSESLAAASRPPLPQRCSSLERPVVPSKSKVPHFAEAGQPQPYWTIENRLVGSSRGLTSLAAVQTPAWAGFHGLWFVQPSWLSSLASPSLSEGISRSDIDSMNKKVSRLSRLQPKVTSFHPSGC